MQKGSALVFVVLLILGIILIAPLPSYSSGPCLMVVGVKCPGWYFGEPLWKRIHQSLLERKNQSGSTTSSSSPSLQPLPFGSLPPYSPKPIPSNILAAIKVIPVNAAQFEKSIVDTDNCGNSIGLVVYIDRKTGNLMKINSTNLTNTDPFKSSMQSVVNFVNHTSEITDYTDIKNWEFAFRDYCGGAMSFIYKEIKNINYPNTDQARAIEVIGGNDGIGFGEIRVYATKGDNVILLSMNLTEDPLYKNINDKCLSSEGFSTKEQAFQCIQNAVSVYPNLDQDVMNKAVNLIKQFAIN